MSCKISPDLTIRDLTIDYVMRKLWEFSRERSYAAFLHNEICTCRIDVLDAREIDIDSSYRIVGVRYKVSYLMGNL
ncbi:hypothetical protein TNCV_2550011 [Trichonephila clavipes]|nr:hypothetical protein TNCV_2550011 [Trichonephila clavipes]